VRVIGSVGMPGLEMSVARQVSGRSRAKREARATGSDLCDVRQAALEPLRSASWLG